MKLEALEEEKRERIIDALLEEYSAEGLENASTNRIVKAAGISKGSLFNYVGSKVDQYLFILDYEIKKLMVVMNTYMSQAKMPTDYLEQLLVISQVKLRVAVEYPRENRLLFNAYVEKDPKVKVFMDQQYDMIATDVLEQHKQMLDPNLLIHPEDRDQVVEMIFHFISGFSDNLLKKYRAFEVEEAQSLLEKVMVDLEQYFEMIRRNFYK